MVGVAAGALAGGGEADCAAISVKVQSARARMRGDRVMDISIAMSVALASQIVKAAR